MGKDGDPVACGNRLKDLLSNGKRHSAEKEATHAAARRRDRRKRGKRPDGKRKKMVGGKKDREKKS